MGLSDQIKKVFFNRVFHHLFFWSAIFAGLTLFNRSDEFQIISSFNHFIFCVLLPLPVYLHFYFLEKFFRENEYHIYIFLTLPMILFFSIFFRSLFSRKMQASNGLFIFFLNLTVFLIITTGLKFLKSNFNQKIQFHQQQTDRLQSEMELERFRINPGFMMHILTHLHQLSEKKSRQIPRLLLQFSDVLRHTIEGSKKEAIELKEEVRQIRDYINLEKQLDKHRIQFKTSGTLRKKIFPQLLMSQVEMTLMAVNQCTRKPVSGEISLESDEKNIFFMIRIDRNNDLKKFSIDLDELKNRMQFIYPDRFTLSTQNGIHSFTSRIQIFQDIPLRRYPGKK